ncbi:MAG: HEAT repeat domain-containing protein [Deltaproteobacteria bacterium]|nr:HEAT repeat domain-containing protein [Deltaproteobacteria bacterium]
MNPDAHNHGLVTALHSAAIEERVAALVSIIENPGQWLGAETVAAIAGCLGADSKTVRRRAADALAAIARRDPTIVAAIRPGLRSDNHRIRFGAAYALGAVGEEALTLDTAAALCEALGSSDGDLRWAAAELMVRLGRTHPKEIREELLALVNSTIPAARKMALYCLRDLGVRGSEVLQAVTVALRDLDAHVRLAALALLSGSFADSDAAPRLMLERLESDREVGVRRAAAVALGHLPPGTALAIEGLRRVASEAVDQSLVRAARTSLERLTRS